MSHGTSSKSLLRSELRKQRNALASATQLAAAEAIPSHIAQLPGWSAVRRVALYLANDGEIDTTPLSVLCRNAGMQLFLPVIDNHNCLSFAEWASDSRLIPNRYNIPEPPASALRCAADELDLLLLPLVGWDRHGGRLGMGGGFYDRSLAGVQRPLLVGLAHSIQQLTEVPRDNWDIPMDFVVTESSLHDCRDSKRSAVSVLDNDASV